MLVEVSTSFEEALTRQARTFEPIRRFVKLPGIAWIRAATFFAYIDTPWRFRGKSPLWKYMGIGLDRRHSGGGHTQLHVTKQANRIVKGMILGAAVTAIDQGENPFADQYRHWINEGGLSPRNARRNVARSLAATLWGMWKNGTEYRPDWVGGGFGKAVSDASL
jgi:transposase